MLRLIGAALGTTDTRTQGRLLAAAVGVIVLLTSLICSLNGVWAEGKVLPSTTSRWERTVSSRLAPYVAGSQTNFRFLAWARRRMLDSSATPIFSLATSRPAVDPYLYQWATYELAPARTADAEADARWIIFYGVPSAQVQKIYGGRLSQLRVYSPAFELGRVR